MISGFQRDFATSKLVRFDLINKNRFTIVHSQCEVSYNIEGFKLKNQDKVNSDIEDIYKKLFVNENKEQVGKTLLLKFVKEIDDLVTELATASNHFVRCIKPNEEKLPQKAQENYMLAQIRYLGVFETIQIRRKIFPARKNYEDFINTFQQVYNNAKGKPVKTAVNIILKEVKAKETDYLLGTKRIYMNKEVDDRLNKELYKFFKVKNEMASKLQKQYRRFSFRKKIIKNLKKLVKNGRIWDKFAKKQRLKLYRHAKDTLVRYCEQKKKKEEEERMKEMMSKKSLLAF
jgi:myosin-7